MASEFSEKARQAYLVQKRINLFGYNKNGRLSIKDALRKRTGDCLEGACVASYLLSKKGIGNFLMGFSAERDEDHVVCVFRLGGKYGAIGKSKFLGLKWRYPVYSSPRELAISYFESYFNYSGSPTLRRYSVPVRIDWKKKGILESPEETERIDGRLCSAKEFSLGVPKELPGVFPERKRAEIQVRK